MTTYDYEEYPDLCAEDEESAAADGMSRMGAPIVRDRWGSPTWAQAKTPPPAWDPTIRWGDSAQFDIVGGATLGVDKLNVKLARPQTCQLKLYARVLSVTAPGGNLAKLQLELDVGNGSITTHVIKTWAGLPALNAPLDVTFPLLPLANVRGRLRAAGTNVSVQVDLWLCPLSL